MNCRVDPSTTLGEKDLPFVGSDGLGEGGSNEGGLVGREVLEEEGREVSILSEMEEVLETEGEKASEEGQFREDSSKKKMRLLTGEYRLGSQSSP